MNRIIQSSCYKLTRRLFLGMLKRNLTICAILFGLTFLLMLGSVNERRFVMPYETLIKISGIRYVFLAALLIVVLLSAYQIYKDNFKTGGIYTLMMLPMPRRHVYLAYCTVGVVNILMIWAAQVLALIASYLPVVARCQYEAEKFEQIYNTVLPFSVARTNGLFLAYVRSDFFHILLPQSWQEALSSVLALLLLGIIPAYTTLLSGTKQNAIVSTFFSPLIAMSTLISRFNILTDGANVTSFIGSTIFTGLLLIIAIIHGIRRMNKDANLIGW